MSTTTTTTSPARFVRMSRGAGVLGRPLPEPLAAKLPAKQRKEHEQLTERVEQARREIARLRDVRDGAKAADHAAARDAALRGEPIPEPSEGRLRGELAEAERIADALEAALRTSADNLLAAAAPKAEEVATELERELGEATEAIRARLADLKDGLAELGQLYAQASWTRSLTHASGASVSPFGRSSATFGETRQKLTVVEQALAYELDRLVDRRRTAEAQRVEQAAFSRDEAGERHQRAAARAEREKAGP